MKEKAGLKRIEDLLDIVKDTDIAEIALEQDGLNIGIKRNLVPEAEDVEETDKKKSEPEKEIVAVYSHSVGHFRDYLLPSRKVLAKVGDEINKGQKLGFIESMKIMKEIASPVKGKVKRKFVKHGSPVEYGQKIFEIEIV
jgi:acetyl-CoA carboxylase biotin carboxyl carrier protein